jgi:hypothetical protein
MEMPFQQSAASLGFEKGRLSHAWQSGEQGSIHEGDTVPPPLKLEESFARVSIT